MQELQTSSLKLTGTPTASGWTQVHDFVPDDEEKLKKRGHLFAVISTGKNLEVGESQGEIESLTTGREILTRIHEEYFGKLEITAFNALKGSVEKIFEEFSESYSSLEIAACSYVDGVVYSAAVGGGEASLFRGNMLATILKSGREKAVAASGYPKSGDIFLLATSEFTRKATGGVIRASLETGDLEAAIESFAPIVHTDEDSSGIGLTLIKFSKDSLPLARFEEKKEETFVQKEEVKPKLEIPGKFAGMVSTLLNKLSKRTFSIRKGEIDIEEVRKRKTTLTAGIILLLVLLVSIGFGIRQRGINFSKERYEDRLVKAEENLAEAESVFTLDPTLARELFVASSSTVNELTAEEVKDERLETLREKIAEGRERILKEYVLSPELFIDLSPLSDGFGADILVGDSEGMGVLDINGNRVVSVETATKKTEIVSGPSQINNAEELAVYTGRFFVSEDDGIFSVGEEKKKEIDAGWEGEILIYAYAGNIYVLDKGASKIWRYAGSEGGFGEGKEWLAPGITTDLSKVTSWTIDGTVWILTETGKIEKYSLGSPQSLANITYEPALANPSQIYTNDEVKGVYILDPGNKRVLVLDKEGNYTAQYTAGELSEAKGVYVSETEKLLIFLSGNRLFSLPLNHL